MLYDHLIHISNFFIGNKKKYFQPYQVNMLVAGHDKSIDKCELYFLDYFGTCMNLPFCAHGYGSNFVLSTMDRHYNESMSIEQAVKLLKRCMGEVCGLFFR